MGPGGPPQVVDLVGGGRVPRDEWKEVFPRGRRGRPCAQLDEGEELLEPARAHAAAASSGWFRPRRRRRGRRLARREAQGLRWTSAARAEFWATCIASKQSVLEGAYEYIDLWWGKYIALGQRQVAGAGLAERCG